MRILMVTQWFDPEPTFKGLLFARELKRAGHQVQVLTGFPNYPGGVVYDGYRIQPFKRERADGIDILRAPLYPSHSQSAVGRVANFLSFALSSTIGALLLKRPDVVYLHHPPGTAALAPLTLLAIKRTPFVIDIQDLWPDTLAATGMIRNERILSLVGRFMRMVYDKAAHIVVLSDGFQRRLVEGGVPPSKISVIPNWTYGNEREDSEAVSRTVHNPLGQPDRFHILFAGTMGKAQRLGAVLEAAALLQQEEPGFHFTFIGGGVEVDLLKSDAAERRLSNVTFLSRVPPAEIGQYLAAADALLVHLKDDPLFEITIPSKTQAYLKAGKPILMGVRGDAANIVERSGAGISFEPESPISLAKAARRMRSMDEVDRLAMGESGRAYYAAEMSLAAGAERWVQVLGRARYSGRRGFIIKRIFDLLVSIATLVIAVIPLVLIALAVALKLGRPVIFSQERPGLHAKPFKMLKFRTMTDERDADGNLLPDHRRLTPFGAWLRRSSLDELPGLFNVITGKMSLVGPRPLLTRYTPFYSAEERLRLSVRPGVTGWAQVNGRNLARWDDRLAMDVWYVKNWSLWLDLRILGKTFLSVIRRKGIVADPESIMQNLDDERR